MEKKFVIFYNDELEPSIALAITNYHKHIKPCAGMGKILGRAGGGKWSVENGTLRLYDLSGDFGPYDKEMAREAFEAKRVFYFDDPVYDDLELKELITE